MQKVILYYVFTPIKDPEAIRLWQNNLCDSLNLKGRIIISKHGINGTLGGDIEDLKTYIKNTKQYKVFKIIEYKWSDGSRDDFPRLSVKCRDEIVTFGIPDELKVNEKGVIGGGKHLKPKQVHELVSKKEVIFMDGRNNYESAVGKFKNAITPEVNTTKEFVKELSKPKYDKLKKKPIVTYCTGGIRCEVLTTILKNKGFEEVYQIDGGIVKYLKEYGDNGLWEGSLYVFDKRMGLKPSLDTPDIGECTYCKENTSRYINCENKQCNQLILVCVNCDKKTYCKKCNKINLTLTNV